MGKEIAPTEIKRLIYTIRGKQVMLDSDLAHLYQVETKRLNEAVSRNVDRFPDDFMFRLTTQEFFALKSQIATSKTRGGKRKLPRVFTEQGVAMLSGVLRSKIAINANIQIMRAFVQIKRLSLTIADLKRKLDGMERKFARHDNQFKIVFNALRQLMDPPKPDKKRKMGFTADK